VVIVLEQMQSRLTELKREYQLGEGQLRELTAQEATLRETLLRISGAIQILEEMLSRTQKNLGDADGGGQENGSDQEEAARVTRVP
jgi:prefoldin subunit 5